MKKVIYILLIFIKIALLCSLCYFNLEHDGEHLVIDINNKESLEENNISYKESYSEFEKEFENTKNLKQIIEEEIVKINKSRDSTMQKLKNIYEEKYKRLKEEELKLKSELDLKVTQIKDDLEKYLIEANDILLYFERTNKALNNYEKNNNNNDLKTLCYISEIQKVNCKAKELLEKPIKNIDIEYNNYIFNYGLEYKYYYFNGMPIPVDIKINKKKEKVYITWDLYDIRIKNYDKENIKYIITINGNKKNIEYETSEKSLLLNKDEFKNNIDYELKICTINNELHSDWSEIKKFKVNDLYEINNNLFFNTGLFGANNPFSNLKN